MRLHHYLIILLFKEILKKGGHELHSDFQTYRFVMIVSILAAFFLSLTATSLKEMQDYNVEVDRKKNVLKCARVDISSATSEEIINSYTKLIKEKVISKDGNYVNLQLAELDQSEDKSTGQIQYSNNGKEYLPLFEYSENDEIVAYILPISGKGLWSTLYGYFSIANDMNTVKGITFYKHGETPGLGAEIEKKWFQDNFIDKTIFNENGEMVSITIEKGIASGSGIKHKVDGISGATMTGTGLNKFLKSDLNRYLPFIKTLELGV
jgi:Na+-transporting NADH:ubiquinone oxidoreductase subunit C